MSAYAPVAFSWMAILLLLLLRRPAPSRFAELQRPAPIRHDGKPAAIGNTGLQILGRVGEKARALVVRFISLAAPDVKRSVRAQSGRDGRRIGLDDRTIGLALVVSLILATVHVALVVVVVAVVVATSIVSPRLSKRRDAARKLEAVERAAPLLLDVLRSGVASGISTHSILASLQVGCRVDDLAVFDECLGSLRHSLRAGVGYVEALEALKDVGSSLGSLVAALHATEHYGVSISLTLDALAVESRLTLRRRVETRARRLPVRLLFPLVVFVLPAFLILTVIPLLVSGFSSIRW